MSNVTVDVVLPVYNGAAYLREAIQSLLDQTYPISNIFILDDGSTDDTIDVVESFQSPLIQFYQSSENKGIVYQLNKGIELSSAKYIARMDADDICFPQRLEKQITFLESNSAYVACSGAYEITNSEGSFLKSIEGKNLANDPTQIPAFQNYLLHPFLVVKRDSLKEISGYREIHFCEDADLYYRLEKVGKLYNLKTSLGKYRIHENSITSNSFAQNFLQSLHSQLMPIHAKRTNYEYCEKKAEQLKNKLLLNSKHLNIKSAINSSKEIYSLSSKEEGWLSKSFPIKLAQNVKYRSFYIRNVDLWHCLQVSVNILISRTPYKYKILKSFFQDIEPHVKHSSSLVIKVCYNFLRKSQMFLHFLHNLKGRNQSIIGNP